MNLSTDQLRMHEQNSSSLRRLSDMAPYFVPAFNRAALAEQTPSLAGYRAGTMLYHRVTSFKKLAPASLAFVLKK